MNTKNVIKIPFEKKEKSGLTWRVFQMWIDAMEWAGKKGQREEKKTNSHE